MKNIEKPKKENYGWHNSSGFDDEPTGWAIEGGEQAYNEALKKWEQENKIDSATNESINHKMAMTVKIEDTEIRNQAHLMDAEGTSDADTKPLEADIIKLLAEKGYNAIEIDISFDTMQNIWRWCCDITHIFGTDGWKEEFAANTSESGITAIGGAPLTMEVAPAETEKLEAVSHPSHYGGKNNPYEVVKIIDAWNLGFDLGNALKYIVRAGKKDKSKEIEDLKKAIFYIDRHIRKVKTVGKPALPIEGSFPLRYKVINVAENVNVPSFLKNAVSYIGWSLFQEDDLVNTCIPDSERAKVEMERLKNAIESVNGYISKLEIQAEMK